ncbi:MAG: hypothetical protein Q7R97_04235 [Candidatus Daviesbacteria bacterium]|nr:hypothetical protein [Candidatus Daviesbacteria bacterium]
MPKGFAHLIVLVGIVLLIVAVLGVWFFTKQPTNSPAISQITSIKSTPTPTPSPWKIYKNDKYGLEITYPRNGVILSEKGYQEGECGKAIGEENGKIDVDNFFEVKIIPWTGTIADYLVSKGAGKIYNTEIIEGTGSDEGIHLVGLKKDFEVAVGYPPLLYVKYLFKKGDNIYIVSTFLHPENIGGCINPEVIDPIKYKKYLDQGWDQKNSFKFIN